MAIVKDFHVEWRLASFCFVNIMLACESKLLLCPVTSLEGLEARKEQRKKRTFLAKN